MEIKTNYDRRLPHIAPIGGMLFITSRLAGTIPKHLLQKWIREKEQAINNIRKQFESDKNFTGHANAERGKIRKDQITKIQKLYFKKVDDYLDQTLYGPTYLNDSAAAEQLAKKLNQYDGEYYDLVAYTVMSNHFHFLIDMAVQLEEIPSDVPITTKNYASLSKVMRLIKGGSAFEINKVIGRKGRLWQPESYDHNVRNAQEFFNIIRYIANNPVKAKIVKSRKEHAFTYVKDVYLDVFL